MFYSHQLLARKAPMGQIWMAATMHAKMSKRKLSKINIIQICDEILNPKVPMALRLSSILMGGVVIVYERKVKILYDDVHRLLVELNEAWKVKLVEDPNILPKGKRQAKLTDANMEIDYSEDAGVSLCRPEAVTLPNQQDTDLGEMERFMDSSTSKKFAAMSFQPSAYFTMNLDAIDEFTENLREEDLAHQHHQADLADITMEDQFDPYQTETVAYTSFERFDLEGDEEIQMQFPSHDHVPVHLSPAPCPSPREETTRGFGMHGMQPESELNQPHDEARDHRQDPLQEPQKKNVSKKKARKPSSKFIIDDEHVLIPNTVYHSWLQNSSDIVSRGRRNKQHAKTESSLKMKYPLDLPNVVLLPDLLGNRNSDHYFPMQLKELWTNMSSFNSPSGRNSVHNARTEPSSPSPHGSKQRAPQNIFDGGHSGFTSGSNASIEEQRAVPAMDGNFMPAEDIIGTGSVHDTTPNQLVNDLTTVLSQASLGSVHRSFTNNSDGNTRSGKKRPHSSSHNNNSGLKTVAENPIDADMEHEPNFFTNEELPAPKFKLAKGLTPENAYTNMTPLLEETGRTQTQTQRLVVDEEMENTTTTIRTHLKAYFEGSGAPQSESLDQLTDGLSRKQAAQLFYQTCVLATREFLEVNQTVAYGDIQISRGAKM